MNTEEIITFYSGEMMQFRWPPFLALPESTTLSSDIHIFRLDSSIFTKFLCCFCLLILQKKSTFLKVQKKILKIILRYAILPSLTKMATIFCYENWKMFLHQASVILKKGNNT